MSETAQDAIGISIGIALAVVILVGGIMVIDKYTRRSNEEKFIDLYQTCIKWGDKNCDRYQKLMPK